MTNYEKIFMASSVLLTSSTLFLTLGPAGLPVAQAIIYSGAVSTLFLTVASALNYLFGEPNTNHNPSQSNNINNSGNNDVSDFENKSKSKVIIVNDPKPQPNIVVVKHHNNPAPTHHSGIKKTRIVATPVPPTSTVLKSSKILPRKNVNTGPSADRLATSKIYQPTPIIQQPINKPAHTTTVANNTQFFPTKSNIKNIPPSTPQSTTKVINQQFVTPKHNVSQNTPAAPQSTTTVFSKQFVPNFVAQKQNVSQGTTFAAPQSTTTVVNKQFKPNPITPAMTQFASKPINQPSTGPASTVQTNSVRFVPNKM